MSSGCPSSSESIVRPFESRAWKLGNIVIVAYRYLDFDELFCQMVDPAEEAIEVISRDNEQEDEDKRVRSICIPVGSVRKCFLRKT